MAASESKGGELAVVDGDAKRLVRAEVDGLSADQQLVMESLAAGASVVETAKASGISRSTIYFWIKKDSAFTAAYNAWHESLKESCRGTIAMLLDKSAAAVQKAVEAGDAKIAMQVLTKSGLLEKEKERNTDEEEIRRERAVAKKNREGKLRRRELIAGSGLRED
jgi:transposase-like protein